MYGYSITDTNAFAGHQITEGAEAAAAGRQAARAASTLMRARHCRSLGRPTRPLCLLALLSLLAVPHPRAPAHARHRDISRSLSLHCGQRLEPPPPLASVHASVGQSQPRPVPPSLPCPRPPDCMSSRAQRRPRTPPSPPAARLRRGTCSGWDSRRRAPSTPARSDPRCAS